MRFVELRTAPAVLTALAALAGCNWDPAPRQAADPALSPAGTPRAASALAPSAASQPAAPAPDGAAMVIDFRNAAALQGWQSADDSVIGGKSQGAIKAVGPASAVFEGNISQYSGGFVTVRCPNRPLDLAGFAGLEIRIRGDGKAYQAMIKTEVAETGFAYYFWFETRPGAWQTVRADFAGFKGNFRGVHLSWAHLDPAKVVSLGFLIANWQEGPFRLEIESIKAYK